MAVMIGDEDGMFVAKAATRTMPSIWSTQVRDSCSAAAKSCHGSYCSKALMRLHKILHIIESVPSQERQIDGLRRDEKRLCGNRGFGIDLNLRLGPFSEAGNSELSAADNGGLSACSGVGKAADTSSTAVSDGGAFTVERSLEDECECDCLPEERDGDLVPIEANRELESEVTNLEDPSSEIGNNGVVVSHEAEESVIHEAKTLSFSERAASRENGYLDLLIEAAKLVSGNFGDSQADSYTYPELDGASKTKACAEVDTKTVNNKRQNWTVEYYYDGGFEEDVSPVVRSKRGRSQVLPYRYRDSVLEPWKRLSRSTAKRRSSRRRR